MPSTVTSATWQPVATDTLPAVGAVTFAVFNNAAEELLYRGYAFLLLMRSYGAGVAVIATSGLFTLLHVQAGIPWPSAIAGVLTSAVLLAALFVRWRSVPLVLGFHVGMNVAQGLIGIRQSGATMFAPVYDGPVSGADSSAVLVLTALINIGLAVVVFVSTRRPSGGTSTLRTR